MITFTRTSAKRNVSFKCPECNTSVVIREINATPNSNRLSSMDYFECPRCGSSFLVETDVVLKCKIHNRPGEVAEKHNFREDIINNLF